uniref:Uncharacterized protein n=1 Tax=Arion vulgaris TaxID=1028688 RepID=A0A0B6ZQF1_9EUPU
MICCGTMKYEDNCNYGSEESDSEVDPLIDTVILNSEGSISNYNYRTRSTLTFNGWHPYCFG